LFIRKERLKGRNLLAFEVAKRNVLISESGIGKYCGDAIKNTCFGTNL
jgi:hypothetical protein